MNIRFLFSFFLMFSFFTCQMQAEVIYKWNYQLEAIDLYKGDRSGNFKGDIVAYLNDGSAWKVHPKQTAEFSDWVIGDSINLDIRTSPYFFKREHHFLLYNYDRSESVKVMPVELGELEISQSSPIYLDLETIRTDYGGYYVIERYKKDLLLSDGSKWVIASSYYNPIWKADSFVPGAKVHVGVHVGHPPALFFLVVETDQGAKWMWVDYTTGKFLEYHQVPD